MALAKASSFARNHNQMNVIRHQAVSDHRQRMLLERLPQQIQVNRSFSIRGENELTSIATLRDMMPNINHYHTS
jgi:hypothetical protein